MSTNFPDEFAEKCWALVAEAKACLQKAREAIEGGNYRDFHAPWSSFLKDTGSILNALHSGTKANPQKRQWYGQTMSDARRDPFLSYMHQARNAEEHEPVWTTAVQKGGFHIDGRGGTYVSTGSDAMITIKHGRVTMDPGMLRSVEGITPYIEYTPRGPRLKTVRAKDGKTFDPPLEFGGRRLRPDDPITIGEIYLAYLEEIIGVALA